MSPYFLIPAGAVLLIVAVVLLIGAFVDDIFGFFIAACVCGVLGLALLIPGVVIQNQQNAEQKLKNAAICAEHDLLWVAEKNICVDKNGFVVNVK